jgi:hypothetical protein
MDPGGDDGIGRLRRIATGYKAAIVIASRFALVSSLRFGTDA